MKVHLPIPAVVQQRVFNLLEIDFYPLLHGDKILYDPSEIPVGLQIIAGSYLEGQIKKVKKEFLKI